MDRHVKTLDVTLAALSDLLSEGRSVTLGGQGLPYGSRVTGIDYRPSRGIVRLVVEHALFPPVGRCREAGSLEASDPVVILMGNTVPTPEHLEGLRYESEEHHQALVTLAQELVQAEEERLARVNAGLVFEPSLGSPDENGDGGVWIPS